VRAGEIIPMGPEMDYVEQKSLDPLTIEIYSPNGEKRILIEEEDKEPIEVSFHRKGQHLEVRVGDAPGRVELVLYGEQVKAAWQNEKALDLEGQPSGIRVSFDGRSGGVVVFELESKA
jgi:hypothetical protein